MQALQVHRIDCSIYWIYRKHFIDFTGMLWGLTLILMFGFLGNRCHASSPCSLQGAKAVKRTDKTTWLLAIDGSPDAERVAQYVARVAKRQGVNEIHLVNVQALDYPRARAFPHAEIEPHAEEMAMGITAPVRAILARAGLVVRLHFPLGGDPAVTIAAVAQRQRAREIVMGTRGMSAAGNLALGSVTYGVVHLAEMPVTLVK